jgi:hypothetical protein
MTEQIFVHRDGERIELQGTELETFLADKELRQAEAAVYQAEQEAKAAIKESAIAKLSALGLTEEEINTIKN